MTCDISDIEGFSFVDTNNFDKKAIYNAPWRDSVVDGNTAFYPVQILALGSEQKNLIIYPLFEVDILIFILLLVRKEEVEDSLKRVPVPKVTVKESSDEETGSEKETGTMIWPILTIVQRKLVTAVKLTPVCI